MVEGDGVRRLIEDLTGEALKDFLRNLRNHSEVQRRVLAGELSQEQVNSAYVRYARRHSAEYRRMVADLTADYYRELGQLSTEYSERFYHMILEGGDDREPPEWGHDAEPETVPLEMHGVIGTELVRRFRIENSDPTPAAVTLEPGWCRGPDGQPFTAPLSIQPASTVVPAGGTVSVTIRVAMLASTFLPGTIYRLPIQVRAPRPIKLDVRIWAEERDVPTVKPHRPSAEPMWRPDLSAPAAKDEEPDTSDEAEEPVDDHDDQPRFAVGCPVCGRVFERKTDDLRLRPHKNTDGGACRGRNGRRVD